MPKGRFLWAPRAGATRSKPLLEVYSFSLLSEILRVDMVQELAEGFNLLLALPFRWSWNLDTRARQEILADQDIGLGAERDRNCIGWTG